MHDIDRATGKSTRLVLELARAMSEGKRVVVITHTYDSGKFLQERLLQVLTVLCPGFVERFGRKSVRLQNGGEARFLPRSQIYTRNTLCGLTIDACLSDVGPLTPEEWIEIAPCIRSQSVVDIDINHFETDEEELPVKKLAERPFKVQTIDEESQPAVPAKERTNARRTLSSR